MASGLDRCLGVLAWGRSLGTVVLCGFFSLAKLLDTDSFGYMSLFRKRHSGPRADENSCREEEHLVVFSTSN